MRSSVTRWVLRATAVGAVGTALVSGIAATQAQAAQRDGTARPSAPQASDTTDRGVILRDVHQDASIPLDGFTISYLPDGVGTVSDFEYEWGEVKFHTKDWESRIGEGWRVDLTVQTLRGDRLADTAALRAYLTEYQEKDPDTWHLTAFRNGSYHGFVSSDQAFWLVRPGLAASVKIDRDRFSHDELVDTAHGFQPA
ncbi:MAG: hypothetical protein WCA46_07710 [Actinocatenispora sp.]